MPAQDIIVALAIAAAIGVMSIICYFAAWTME